MGYANIEDKRAYHKNYMKERRLWLKEHHCCTECGKQDAYTLNGRSRCFDCNAKKNNTHGDKAKRNANMKDFDITQCYIIIDTDGNAYARSSWDGNTFVEDKGFDDKTRAILEVSKDYYIVTVDIHD